VRASAPLAAAAIAVAVLLGSGCGDRLIDSNQAEGYVVRGLLSRGLGSISSVRCPKDVDAEQGSRLRCTARSSRGGPLVVTLRVLDDEGTVQPVEIRARR
jgi:Domain of unknown function (DUF4333)